MDVLEILQKYSPIRVDHVAISIDRETERRINEYRKNYGMHKSLLVSALLNHALSELENTAEKDEMEQKKK